MQESLAHLDTIRDFGLIMTSHPLDTAGYNPIPHLTPEELNIDSNYLLTLPERLLDYLTVPSTRNDEDLVPKKAPPSTMKYFS